MVTTFCFFGFAICVPLGRLPFILCPIDTTGSEKNAVKGVPNGKSAMSIPTEQNNKLLPKVF